MELEFDNLFQNNFASSSSIDSTSRKQKSTKVPSTLLKTPRTQFEENDGVFIGNINMSVGSIIGNMTRNDQIVNRQTRYFVTCDMNGILEFSDKSEGSQLNRMEDSKIAFRALKDIPALICHWGDTTSEEVKEAGGMIRMDLRILNCKSSKKNSVVDVRVLEAKHYKDKLKTALSSRVQLNSLLRDFEDLNKDQFNAIRGLGCEVYSLRLAANELYVVDIVYFMNFPSLEDIESRTGITNFLCDIFILNNMCRI